MREGMRHECGRFANKVNEANAAGPPSRPYLDAGPPISAIGGARNGDAEESRPIPDNTKLARVGE
jgi:hypothetical protein